MSGTVARRFRAFAMQRGQSMSSLVEVALLQMMEGQDKHAKATERLIERMKNSPDRGTGGKITWTRDEIHER